MWIVVKYNFNEEELLKSQLIKNFGNETFFYNPKIRITKVVNNNFKNFEKKIINNYLLCFNKKFKELSLLKTIKFLKGLSHLLPGCFFNQKNISDFFNNCKNNEDNDGFLKSDYLLNLIKKKDINLKLNIFSDLNCELIGKNRKYTEVLMNNKLVKVNNNSKLLFQPI